MFEHLAAGLKLSVAGSPLMAVCVAFAAGFLVSLTPCVYPMLPITVGFIGGGIAGQGRARGFSLSLFYVLGLSVTYSVLGIASALMNRVFGFASGSPVIMLVAGLFFVLFGLSMMDVFSLPLPQSLQNIQPKSRGGFAGAFMIGLASGLMAAPCSTPVLLAILTHIAQRGGVVYGLMLMFVYAMGLGTLIVVIGTWAGASRAMPKSGPWMVWIKRLFGIAIIAAGAYYAITAGASLMKRKPAPVAEKKSAQVFHIENDTSRVDAVIGKKPVLLVFFGSWCAKCGEETGPLNALYDDVKNTGLEFYAVDINDPEDKGRAFVRDKKIRYPVIFDAKGAYADKFEIISAPTFVVFAKDGKRLYYGADEIAKIRPIIDKAAGGK